MTEAADQTHDLILDLANLIRKKQLEGTDV
jgi:hypothetical protein